MFAFKPNPMKIPRCFLLLAVLPILVLAGHAQAELRLGAPFSDHMVVQHDKPLTIWGWDEPGQVIAIVFADGAAKATAAPDGRWEAEIATPAAGGPFEIEVTGSSAVTLRDVLSGEVWLASGQSNLEFPLGKSEGGEEALRNAADGQLRILKIPHVAKEERQDDVSAEWQVASPETAGQLGGVPYFFAERLRKDLGRPVGIIQAAWGGSKIQAWLPLDVMKRHPNFEKRKANYEKAEAKFRSDVKAWEAGGKSGKKPQSGGGEVQYAMSRLDNAMMHPLQPFPLAGVIWYQGESDSHDGQGYRDSFRTLVEEWRQRFRVPELPVYFVQLPNLDSESARKNWADFRIHQSKIPDDIPHTDYAVTIDAGDAADLHPRNKRTPGRRLAQLALAYVYGLDIVPGGPVPMAISGTNEMLLRFRNAGSGLVLKTAEGESPFEFHFEDGTGLPVVPRVEGVDSLVFTVPDGKKVKSLSYADSANPVPTLYNREEIPATPFRMPVKEPWKSR